MKLPRIVKTRAEAKAIVDQLFALPPAHEMPKDTVGITKLRMEQADRLREMMDWLLTGPKIYKRAAFDLTYDAAQRLDRNLSHLHHLFSSAWTREKTPEGIRRLRDAA